MPKSRYTGWTISKLTKRAQHYFNAWIRHRDSDGKPYFVCISCGESKPLSQMNAGHFYPVSTSSALRFSEDNVHGECVKCNAWKEDHLIGYARRLPAKIGEAAMQNLHSVATQEKMAGRHKWTRQELIDIIEKYKTKLR